MSFSTSQPSSESRIFSHDLEVLAAIDQLFGNTHSIIADTNCRRDIRKCPQATLRKIESLFFEILEFLSPH